MFVAVLEISRHHVTSTLCVERCQKKTPSNDYIGQEMQGIWSMLLFYLIVLNHFSSEWRGSVYDELSHYTLFIGYESNLMFIL